MVISSSARGRAGKGARDRRSSEIDSRVARNAGAARGVSTMTANPATYPATFASIPGTGQCLDPVRARVTVQPTAHQRPDASGRCGAPTRQIRCAAPAARHPWRRSARPPPRRRPLLGRVPGRRVPAPDRRHQLAARPHAKLARFTLWRKSLPCISTTTHISCNRDHIRSPMRSPSVSSRMAPC